MTSMTTARDPFSLDENATTEVVQQAIPYHAAVKMATNAQFEYAKSLIYKICDAMLAHYGDDDQIAALEEAYMTQLDCVINDRRETSKMIDTLKATHGEVSKLKPAATPAAEAPEGIHLVGEEIFKVQVAHHGSGKKYAKQLDKATGKFEYVGRGPLAKLSEATLMTLEQAQEFGHLYGMCIKCGRTLTDENSIAAGIGPVCAEGF